LNTIWRSIWTSSRYIKIGLYYMDLGLAS